MYLNCLKNKKGQSLLTVLVVASVLIILAAALSESAFIDYTSTLADTNNNYAYNAAESAVEMCFDRLNQICGNESFASDRGIQFNGTNTKDFADNVVRELNEDINSMKDSDIFQKINISDNQKNSAKTVLLNIQLAGTPIYDPPYMRIPVGLTAQATYDPTVGNPQTRQVYAKKEIKVLAFEQFKLRGAVYTIGDMVALPSSTTNIKGDVFVYGSSPAKSSQSEQDSYGGIIGKENSNLTIDGNAYSRSFIRTSGLDSTVSDNNIITIKKDAIAQSIQVFSKNSEIVVHRDAYTFDDLEMNGENSLIAINNNYFGLSKGKSFHDESSAVVNSASIYNDSDDSKKSRIVINGDVLLNGGTFKFDPDTGNTQGQIEDASVAWLTTTPPDAILEKPLYTDWENYNQNYDVWLRASGYGYSSNTIRGFGNIFQAWTPRTESQITQWLDDIKNKVVKVGYNDFTAAGVNAPDTISGFSNYEIAANDTMYFFTDNDGIVSEDFYKGLKKAQYLFGKFNLDMFYNDSVTDGSNLITDKSTVINYWKTFWDSCNIGWKGQNMYLPSVSDKLNKLSELLKAKAPFYKREDYQYLDENKEKPIKDSVIVHKSNSQFQTLINQLTEVVNNHSGSPYIYSDIKGQITDPGSSNEWEITAPPEPDKLYLFVNTEHPDINIVIDNTTVNGIIFTTGKVIVRNGGKLNGAVIAAGPGYINMGSYVAGSACGTFTSGSGITETKELSVPRVTADNKSIFEAGGYAAVQFENGSSTNKNEIKFIDISNPNETDPKAIRDYYINTFNTDENDLIDLDKILK